MNRIIKWSPRAKSEYFAILDYLANRWGKSVSQKYIERVSHLNQTIAHSPELFPISGKKRNIRRAVVTKQTSLYFRVKDDRIELITLFDTRQSPKKRGI